MKVTAAEINIEPIAEAEAIELEDIVGPWGPWQRKLFLVFTIVYLISPFQGFGMVFYGPQINYTCVADINNKAIKDYDKSMLNISKDHCYVNNITPCGKWEYDHSFWQKTIVDEFDVVCSRSTFISIGSLVHQVGYIVSGLLCGYISDRTGRLRVFRLSIFLEIIAGFSQALSLNIYHFLISRFFLGLFAFGRYLTGYLLLLEWTGKNYRANVTLALELGFVFGYMLLPVFAYLIPHFRNLQMFVSGLEIISIFFLWDLPESARWQIAKGYIKEAEATIRRAATMRGKIGKEELERKLKILKANVEKEEKEKIYLRNQNLFQLWMQPIYLRYCLILYFSWFTASFVYYGFSLNVRDLGGNIFINSFLFGVAEGISKLVLFFAFVQVGRKPLLSSSLIISGLASLAIIPFIGKPFGLEPTIVLAFISRFAISATYHVIYLQTSETFPTNLRQLSLGSCSAAARVGSNTAPFMKELSEHNHSITMSLYGLLSLFVGGLCLFLPETKGKEIPNNIEEAIATHGKKPKNTATSCII